MRQHRARGRCRTNLLLRGALRRRQSLRSARALTSVRRPAAPTALERCRRPLAPRPAAHEIPGRRYRLEARAGTRRARGSPRRGCGSRRFCARTRRPLRGRCSRRTLARRPLRRASMRRSHRAHRMYCGARFFFRTSRNRVIRGKSGESLLQIVATRRRPIASVRRLGLLGHAGVDPSPTGVGRFGSRGSDRDSEMVSAR